MTVARIHWPGGRVEFVEPDAEGRIRVPGTIPEGTYLELVRLTSCPHPDHRKDER